MLIARPIVMSIVRDDQIPIVREQSVVRDHRARLGVIEREPVGISIATSEHAPRSSSQLAELRREGRRHPGMLDEQLRRGVINRRAVSGGQRHGDIEA
jgi:hypothetical protein